ncbi:type I-MYXAN CRISPR-associated protein Cas6/Cmx6 [Cystobacter ferrugineus]|uniref:type I-MYXAN CRISPR-associated protein Cas6/Cmx6 n=1 Tax=Cystobacter ferrugineus TaxID=83449 RepID=UPI000903352B|nr:type I-MYXAN CRISPR-associated protein Cas6/Cmx6 [Cystobacter ferrugineus]
MSGPFVDLLFPVRGGLVPLDHGYLLFSALSHRLPDLHERPDIGIFNLRGTSADAHALHVGNGTLRLRCPADAIARLLPLAGSTLVLAGQPLHLGAPRVHALSTPSSLSARLVTFKHALDSVTFQASVLKFLAELGCLGTPALGRRRIVSISGKKVVGFALTVRELSPDSSLRLQTLGLGGRRHMGCGLFLPTTFQSS